MLQTSPLRLENPFQNQYLYGPIIRLGFIITTWGLLIWELCFPDFLKVTFCFVPLQITIQEIIFLCMCVRVIFTVIQLSWANRQVFNRVGTSARKNSLTVGTGDQPAGHSGDIFIHKKLLGGAVQCFGDNLFQRMFKVFLLDPGHLYLVN